MDTMFDTHGAEQNQLSKLRPLIIFCVVALLALGIGIRVAAEALASSFEQVESAATTQKAQQVYRAFDGDLRQLEISNRDFAEWDAAEHFIRERNREFISGNFSATTLKELEVDLVWIADGTGADLYSGFLDTSSHAVVSPAPRPLLEEFRRFLTTDRSLRSRSPAERVLRTSQGLAAVSTIEIARSDHTHPTGSVMLFARFIDERVLQRVRKTTQLQVSMAYFSGAPVAAPGIPQAVVDWLAAAPDSASSFVYAPNADEIVGYAAIRDLDHRPIALFSTRSARDIVALGHRTTWNLLGIIVTLLVIFGAAVGLLMQRLRRSFAERQAAQQRHQNITAQLQDCVVFIDADSLCILEANEAVQRALDSTLESIRTRSIHDLFPDIPRAVLQSVSNGASAREVHESRLCRGDGTAMDTEVIISCIDDNGRRLLSLVGRDISHRREANEQRRKNRRRLVQLAQHDPLTGLPNRLFLHSRLPKVLQRAATNDRHLGVISLDIDHFKNINDSRGHGCGDQLLQIIAKRLRASVSAEDVVTRMGGDEFVIIISLMPDTQAVDDLVGRLQTAVQAAVMIGNEAFTVSASMGIAVFPQDGRDVETLLKHADIALYQAKEGGRRCHRFFCADMDIRVSQHMALEQAMRHALGSEQFYLDYQPIMDLASGHIASMEALMRWRHPELGLIPPMQFIPVAERSGLIEELGKFAIRRVLAQLRQWADEGVPVVPIAVNVATVQLEHPDFAPMVAGMAEQAGVEMCWLRFEITESAMIKETERIIGTLRALRALGAKILVDDFGTGYSSLSYLARLPVDTLKIDRAFVRDMEKDLAHASIVRSVISMAKELNLTTTAEGVETPEQFHVLCKLGCDYLQGYYYSRPVPASHCKLLLEQLQRERLLSESPPQRGVRHRAFA